MQYLHYAFFSLQDLINILNLIQSPNLLEVGYFKIEDVLKIVTWINYSERIEMCLNEGNQPFVIEFKLF